MALAYRCSSCNGINRVDPGRRSDRPVCGRCQAPLDLSAMPGDVTDEQLERLVRGAPVPVLVDFWAPWCGPCRVVAPAVTELAARHAGRLIVVKVNTDEQSRTATALKVEGIPTFAVYAGGRLREQRSGALPKSALEALLAPHLAPSS